MFRSLVASASLVVLFASLTFAAVPSSPARRTPTSLEELRYSRSHSLGDKYSFDTRDGWAPVNITNLPYKYSSPPPAPVKRAKSSSIKYTGHDLKNPSCWTDTEWAPTDDSFACALTLDGWKTKPECFKFIELPPKKRVFVRVVDTCAGCAKGSRHVDLTRAAFGQLADYDEGVLTVQMRMATEPDGWYENLWGPKAT
ncbi:hypothetical protein OF83DRAFT_1168098 [Amylostereum chailletii]|nr:hypothetical protein OF83DRAFT_1168098 [Amylostereum chailletii]